MRLPIYFLIDTSLSMSGKPIEKVERCINGTLKTLKSNSKACEDAILSIITYGNNKVYDLIGYKEILEVGVQKFHCSGFSNINYGLEAVKDNYNKNFIKTTTEKKGDWKPMLFVFSGIAPTTKIDNSLIDFFEKKFSHGHLDHIESFVGKEFENISEKANYTLIVTSENEFARNSFENYFTNVFSYEDVDSFVYKFNNFFRWNS